MKYKYHMMYSFAKYVQWRRGVTRIQLVQVSAQHKTYVGQALHKCHFVFNWSFCVNHWQACISVSDIQRERERESKKGRVRKGAVFIYTFKLKSCQILEINTQQTHTQPRNKSSPLSSCLLGQTNFVFISTSVQFIQSEIYIWLICKKKKRVKLFVIGNVHT